MQIPTVTDSILRQILRASTSPVLVLFQAGDQDRMWLAGRRFESVKADRVNEPHVVFVQIGVLENPTISAQWMDVADEPEIVGFNGGEYVARVHGDFTTEAIKKLVGAVLAFGRGREA